MELLQFYYSVSTDALAECALPLHEESPFHNQVIKCYRDFATTTDGGKRRRCTGRVRHRLFLLNPLRRQPSYSFGESGQKQVELVSLFASVRGFDGGEHRRLERIKSVAEGGAAGLALAQKLAYFNG